MNKKVAVDSHWAIQMMRIRSLFMMSITHELEKSGFLGKISEHHQAMLLQYLPCYDAIHFIKKDVEQRNYYP